MVDFKLRLRVRLYSNWYQLNDNGLYDEVREKYDLKAFARLCLGNTKARLLPDKNTIVICNCASGYKLKLDQHPAGRQDEIIDILTPYFVDL